MPRIDFVDKLPIGPWYTAADRREDQPTRAPLSRATRPRHGSFLRTYCRPPIHLVGLTCRGESCQGRLRGALAPKQTDAKVRAH